MCGKNLVIMAPMKAKMTPVDGVKELAPLHKSLLQEQIPEPVFLRQLQLTFL